MRDDRILAVVFGDIFLGVIRAHLLLIDVLLEDVTQHIGIDLIPFLEHAFIQMPAIAIKELKELVKGFIGDLNLLAIQFFDLMLLEDTAIEIGNIAK